ncbi:hypothetical protein D3C75_591740 [compost metagenome]
MVTVDKLIEDGFTLEQYPDGKFWLFRKDEDMFLQIDEALTNITLYQDGWVDDSLTDEEYQLVIEKFKVIDRQVDE